MSGYAFSHLADHVLLRELDASDSRGSSNDAVRLDQLGEVYARKLYLAAGYSSMFAYCVGARHYSEDVAFKRIRAARMARKYPVILPAVADGRLHLSAVVLLAPHLSAETVDELVAAASHKSKTEIERLLAARFPKPDLPTRIRALGSPALAGHGDGAGVAAPAGRLAPGPVAVPPGPQAPSAAGALAAEVAPGPVAVPAEPSAARRDEPPVPRARVVPLAPQRFAWQLTVSASTNDKLQYARALLGHAVPGGEVSEVLDRALDSLIEKVEKQVFAATARPRRGRASKDVRHVPAAVKRGVWVRDGGRCTFTSDTGHRCESRTRLQFDHLEPVARGGCATVAGMRLLCAAHNQHAADCTLGRGFMDEKRGQARHAKPGAGASEAVARALQPRANDQATPTPPPQRPDAEALTAAALEVIPWLREVGERAARPGTTEP